MEVTLFGFELDIVERCEVAEPLPLLLRRPRMRLLRAAVGETGDPPEVEWRAEVYRHTGLGIYRRVQ